MKPTQRRTGHLSIHRAFVIHLYDAGRAKSTQLAGRVEHVVSGRSGVFGSAQSLARFLSDTSTELGQAGGGRDEPWR